MPNADTRKNFGVRLPASLIAAIEAQAKATGQNKTQIVEAALGAYLGIAATPTEGQDVDQRLTEIEQRLANVEQRLTENAQRRPTPPNATPATERTPTRQSSTKAPPPVDGPEYPLADGVNLLTTSQTWEYCLGLGWVSPEGSTSKASWRSWARRNLVPLMERYGVEPTGYQGKSNAVASYRRVMMPDGV